MALPGPQLLSKNRKRKNQSLPGAKVLHERARAHINSWPEVVS